jgi:hypothetical protein
MGVDCLEGAMTVFRWKFAPLQGSQPVIISAKVFSDSVLKQINISFASSTRPDLLKAPKLTIMMNFYEASLMGKKSESLAEAHFKRRGLDFEDVRDCSRYQAVDVDYVVNGKLYEVKQNFHVAKKGPPGEFIWVELSIDEKPGWWYFTKADYFLFFSLDGRQFVEIPVDKIRDKINSAIENRRHTQNCLYRFDYTKDCRYYGVVTAKSIRVYLSEIEGCYKRCRIPAIRV